MNAPARDEVHVWLARTAVDADTLARMSSVLDDEERVRAARYRFDEDRARSIVARASLREILARYLGRDAHALHFIAGEHGKPALADRELEFNVSHSGDLVALAFASATPVGIDIERERELNDANALARRFFSPAEAAAVLEDASRFFRIWTAKEALIKAVGAGLSLDLASFETWPAAARFVPVVDRTNDASLQGWSVYALDDVPDGYRCAIVTRGGEWNVSVRTTSQE